MLWKASKITTSPIKFWLKKDPKIFDYIVLDNQEE